MSMRRSRLQVKPNIGASKVGARGNKTDDKTARPGNKVTNRESLKSPEKAVGKSPSQSVNESLQQNAQNVEKWSVPTGAQIQNQKSSISRTTIPSLSSTAKSPIHQPEQEPLSKTCLNEELTKIKSKADIVEDSTDVRTVNDSMAKSPPTEGTELTDSSDKTNSKPVGRLRNRFSRKVKPNLSEAGKSRNRKSTSSVEAAPKPSVSVTSNTSIHEPESKAKVDNMSAPVVEARVPSTHTSLIEIPDVLSHVNDTPEVAAEVMVAAEVECPTEEVDVYQGRGPARDLSPSSIADSCISHTTDCSTFPNLPEPGHKPVKKRIKVLAPLDKPPDKCKMLMKDLIYWNPVSNPMKDREKKSASSEKSLESVLETSPAKEPPEEPPDPDEAEESLPVPQVKIGPDGSIILNEESLVIDRKSDQSELDDIGVLDETDVVSTYASFRARHLSKNWSDKETERFYSALSVVGTDFSMMCNLFKKRNRQDLKKKFKREEKNNRPKVDKALRERKKLDMSVFENVSEEEDEIEAEKKKKKKEKSQGKGRGRGKNKQATEETQENNKPTKKRKSAKKKRKGSQYFCEDSEEEVEEDLAQITSDTPVPEAATVQKEKLLELEEDDEDNEDDGMRTIAKKDDGNSSDEDELDIMNSMCQTTRSGRVPKRTSVYNVSMGIPRKRSKKETSVNSQSTDPLEDDEGEEGVIIQSAVPDGDKCAQGSSVTAALTNQISTEMVTAASTNQTSTEIHTVQNIPSVGGSQIVLVTQKGQGSSDQGTVIHVYMLSPTGSRTPEWSGRSSPRVNPHVYSASPRPHGPDWHIGNPPRFPSASHRRPIPAVPKHPVSVPLVQQDTVTPSTTSEQTPTSNFNSTNVTNNSVVQIADSTNTECESVLNKECNVLEESI